jgi:transcriptional antiterminator RfaH
MNWYLVQTKRNMHKIACENLRRQGLKVFSPLMIKTRKKNSKFINSTIPLFPGYIFMGTALNAVPWKSVNATRGVSKAVSLDGKYYPLHIQIVKGIRFRCDKNDILQTMDHIDAGDRVKIERGPLADFICRVEKIKDRERVWVLIDMLQQQTRTEVSLNDLSKIH